ncbi:hypothetical protein FHS96_004976 [Sphingomonas zeicaulis]|uniref:hypothetical protein n=1 Tax=Sphingomonas zeicaulis TaxID=1632740 RepID=UPI003D22A309
MSAPFGVTRLQPVGPVAARFLQSRAFVCGIMGPVGSGKTLTCCQKLLRIGAMQKGRVDRQGVTWRKAKVGVIRDTYPNIDENVLPSWFRLVPKHIGKFTGDAPRSHKVQIVLRKDENGRAIDVLDLEAEFRAIGDKSVEQALRGWEINAAWINEADTLAQGVWEYLSGRVGRFSDLDPKLVVDPQIIMDFNAPDIDNYTYKLFIDNELDDGVAKALSPVLQGQPLIEFYQQPRAILDDNSVNPNAENLANLPLGYYERQIAVNKSKNYINRMLKNQFAPVVIGQPVYPEFDFARHVATEPLQADRSRTLVIGLDGGLTPAAVAGQRTSLGDLRVLGELAVFAEEGETLGKAGATRFGQALRAWLVDKFPHHYRPGEGDLRGHNGGPRLIDDEFDRNVLIEFWCDPSAKDGTDNSGNEKSWMEIVAGIIGYRIRPARTNRLHTRLEVVRQPMLRHDGFLMSADCKILRRGFLGGYHYQRVAIGDGTGRFANEPSKNMFSHSQDALQYLALADGDAVREVNGKDRRRRGQNRRARVNFGNDYFSGGAA